MAETDAELRQMYPKGNWSDEEVDRVHGPPVESEDIFADALNDPEGPAYESYETYCATALNIVEAELTKRRDEYHGKSTIEKRNEFFAEILNPNFWVCLVFQSQEQKEEFLEKKGWLEYGPVFLDGERIAREVEGIQLQPVTLRADRIGKLDKEAVALVRPEDIPKPKD